LQHGERGEDLPALGDLPDAEVADAVAVEAGDLLALEADGARARLEDPRDGADERGLAGAVGADEGDDLAGAHRQAHLVERLGVAVVDGEVTNIQHQCTAPVPRQLATTCAAEVASFGVPDEMISP